MPTKTFDPEQARWILLVVGLVALTLAVGLILLIRLVRKRYRAGREAIDQLRGTSRGMHLEMSEAADSAL